MKRALITGVAGFGGSRLAEQLLNRGYEVTGIDIVPPLQAVRVAHLIKRPDMVYRWKSLQDIQPEDVKGHAVVAHLAAQADTPLGFDAPRWTVAQNIDGTVALLEAVRRAGDCERFLYAASGNELGHPKYLPIDEQHPLTPHNPYGFSKAAAELAAWTWHRCYGVPSVVIGTGVVIGTLMRREVFIFRWLWNALHGDKIVVEGGSQTRDISHITDVAEAWVRAIEAPAKDVVGEKFLIGQGVEWSVSDLADMCRDVAAGMTGNKVPIERVGFRPGEQGQREVFNTQKARRVLGYSPRYGTSEAVAHTARWIGTLV